MALNEVLRVSENGFLLITPDCRSFSIMCLGTVFTFVFLNFLCVCVCNMSSDLNGYIEMVDEKKTLSFSCQVEAYFATFSFHTIWQ